MTLRTAISAFLTFVVLAILFVFGKVTGGFFPWFLFYFSLVLGIYEWLTMFVSLTGLNSQRQLGHRRLSAGQSLNIRMTLTNKRIWPIFWLRLEQTLPPRWRLQSSGLDAVHIPLWRRKMEFPYTVRNIPRGVYRLAGTTVETGDLLGLVRLKKTFLHSDKLVVYPRVVPVRGWNGESADDEGERQPTNRRSEESSNVIGVRDYMPGDRLSRIHWAVTARRGQLQSKEFELHVTSDFLFIPDNTVASYPVADRPEEKFDLAMSITASLIRNAYDNHRKFGMVVPVDPHLSYPTGSAPALLEKCMEGLAAMQPTSPRDICAFLDHVAGDADRGTVFVLISPRLERDMAIAISHLVTQGTVHAFIPLLRERLNEAERAGYQLLQSVGANLHLIRTPEQLSFMHKGGGVGATTISSSRRR